MIEMKDKIFDLQGISDIVEQWRKNGQKIVFTNGCFDILHFGHLSYLQSAFKLGNKLIIGLNSDESVTKLKGKYRPINDIETRKNMLAALFFVDAVVIFEEDTPINLIETVIPDILVKGGDWSPEQIIGSDFVLSNGGEVMSIPFIEGYSTTNIEQKILNRK